MREGSGTDSRRELEVESGPDPKEHVVAKRGDGHCVKAADEKWELLLLVSYFCPCR